MYIYQEVSRAFRASAYIGTVVLTLSAWSACTSLPGSSTDGTYQGEGVAEAPLANTFVSAINGDPNFLDFNGGGFYWNYNRQLYGRHLGRDWGGTTRTQVKAIANGRVIYAGGVDYGNLGVVIIEHRLAQPHPAFEGDMICSGYAHVANRNLPKNTIVNAGDIIGTLFYQGNNTHLHLAVADHSLCEFFKTQDHSLGSFWGYRSASDEGVIKGWAKADSTFCETPELGCDRVVKIAAPDGNRNNGHYLDPEWVIRVANVNAGD